MSAASENMHFKKQKLIEKQIKQIDKIKALMKKIDEYEQSELALSTSLNFSWEERDTIKRALTCHLEFLRKARDKNRNELQASEVGKEVDE